MNQSSETRRGEFIVVPRNPSISVIENRIVLQPGGSSIAYPPNPTLDLSGSTLTVSPGGSSVVLPTTLNIQAISTASPQTLNANNVGQYLIASGGTGAITLPTSGVPQGGFISIRNNSSGAISITSVAGYSLSQNTTGVFYYFNGSWGAF